MRFPGIRAMRAFVVRGGGVDCHDQGDGHRIDDQPDKPGFGVELNREIALHRPCPR
jgi:hypothetical protein